VSVSLAKVKECSLNCLLFVGAVSKADFVKLAKSIRSDHRACSGERWLIYVDPFADISELDVDCLVELKNITTKNVPTHRGLDLVIISNSRFNDIVADAWCLLVDADPDYPYGALRANDVAAAAELMGLTARQAEIVRRQLDALVAGEG
jgi:hypothetical protein